MSNYNSGPHLDWWHSLDATKRFELMKKYEVSDITNKAINRIFKKAIK